MARPSWNANATSATSHEIRTELLRCELDLAEIGYDLVRPMLEQVQRMGCGSDTDDKAETAGASCFDTRRRILEDCRTRRRCVETACSFQKHVGSRLPSKAQSIKIDAVDSCIEQRRQTGSVQNFRAMVAR